MIRPSPSGWLRLIFLLVMFMVTEALAARPLVRFALVIGNNETSAPAVQLPPLRHAEREARELGARLVRYGNFDPDGTIVVTGAGREQILSAARQLGIRHRARKAELDGAPTLFALFFTGHGLSGKLMVEDGALTGTDLAAIFREVDATLTVGVFDACFAGSLDGGDVLGKGVVPTPGFNPIAELPNEVLNAEGTLWFVSSRPNEQSFEDTRLGGLFTHFFIESFTEATPDAMGVTLESMWEYARSRTSALAAKHGRTQSPVKIVRNFKAEGPVYFSFPRQRTARLRFTPEVEGTFLLQYQHGAIVERVVKSRGAPLEVALFSGEVRLIRLGGEAPHPSAQFQLAEGQRVVIARADMSAGRSVPGFAEPSIRTKGEVPGLDLRSEPPWTWNITIGAASTPVSEDLMSSDLNGALGMWAARGPWSFGVEAVYGGRRRRYEAWRYAVSEFGIRVAAGAGTRLGPFRLDLEALASPSWLAASYGSGAQAGAGALWAGGGLRASAQFPIGRWGLAPYARASMGVKLSRSAAHLVPSPAAAPQPSLQLGVALQWAR